MSPATGRLPRGHRLTDKPQFDLVHREGTRASDERFMVIARPNGLGHPRLGMAVGLRVAGNAVNRNRIRRVIREVFRTLQLELPPVDLVVNARPAAGQSSNRELVVSVTALCARIRQRCARS